MVEEEKKMKQDCCYADERCFASVPVIAILQAQLEVPSNMDSSACCRASICVSGSTVKVSLHKERGTSKGGFRVGANTRTYTYHT